MPAQKYRQNNIKISHQNKNDVINSVLLAYKNKIELNRFLTLNLESISPNDPKKALRFIMDRYKKFSNSYNFQAAYVWVLENNQGNNLHAHILMHIPASAKMRLIYKFKEKLRSKWLEKSNSIINKEKNWFNSKTIRYGSFYNYTLLSELLSELKIELSKNSKEAMSCAKKITSKYTFNDYGKIQFHNPVNTVAYVLKGIEQNTQGLVAGRRIGRSHNLICNG